MEKDKSSEFFLSCVVLTGVVATGCLLWIQLPKWQQQNNKIIKLETQLEMTQQQLKETNLIMSGKREK